MAIEDKSGLVGTERSRDVMMKLDRASCKK